LGRLSVEGERGPAASDLFRFGSFATEIGSPRNVRYYLNRCKLAQRITLLESVREQLAFRANYERLKAERQAREAARVTPNSGHIAALH
jgi:hypothetical protein